MWKCYACNNVKIYINDIEILHNGFKLSKRNDKILITIKNEIFKSDFKSLIYNILENDSHYYIKMIFKIVDTEGKEYSKSLKLWCKLPEGDIYDYSCTDVMHGEFCFEILEVLELLEQQE